MARSRIRNLDQGYRLCEHCGRQYHWSTFCTCQIRAEVEAIKAEAAERKAKRVVMVSDSNGQRYDREWFQREVIDARNADAKRQQPAYDRDFYAGIIAARINDPHQHEDGQVSLPDMMLLTGRIDHAQWMALVWPTLPEIEY